MISFLLLSVVIITQAVTVQNLGQDVHYCACIKATPLYITPLPLSQCVCVLLFLCCQLEISLTLNTYT